MVTTTTTTLQPQRWRIPSTTPNDSRSPHRRLPSVSSAPPGAARRRSNSSVPSSIDSRSPSYFSTRRSPPGRPWSVCDLGSPGGMFRRSYCCRLRRLMLSECGDVRLWRVGVMAPMLGAWTIQRWLKCVGCWVTRFGGRSSRNCAAEAAAHASSGPRLGWRRVCCRITSACCALPGWSQRSGGGAGSITR